MDPRIRTEFVRRSLIDMGYSVNEGQLRAINKLLQFQSGNLSGSKGFGHYDVTTGDGMDGKLTFRHPIYERFLDMKRLMSPSGKVRKTRSYPVHNKIIFGNLNTLVNNLMNGLVDEVVAEIKSDLEIQ